ncbi:uncharacterized protein LOC141632662 [Silene latifolia]|uniref:uncharacterized protein LOC141632662 n=1 Tax=Silene latifolia TaxID=37657 RepID=UPI003D774424
MMQQSVHVPCKSYLFQIESDPARHHYPAQSAFIKGRDIVGNILIRHDLITLYKRKACSPRLMMKIDLQKVFDTIEWSFHHDMPATLNFPQQSIKLLMECVTSPSYSLSLYGELLLQLLHKLKGFKHHSLCTNLNLTRLCFADDLLMFSRGDTLSVTIKIRVFEKFSVASGMKLSNGKSNFYCNGIPDPIVQANTRATGRVVLIKSVMGTLHNYWAHIFILPKTVLDKIDALCRRFLWHGTECKGSLALVSWSQVKWVHAIYMQHQRWQDYEHSVGTSWAWRKICGVKQILKELIFYENWRGTNVEYTIKLGYHWLEDEAADVNWFLWVNIRIMIPKHALFI